MLEIACWISNENAPGAISATDTSLIIQTLGLRLTHTGLRSHFDSRSIPVLLRTLTLIESVQAATQEIDAPLDLPALVELLLHYVTSDGQPATDQGK